MIWPFKKKDVIPFSEHVKTLPAPACANPVKHYTYHYNGVLCHDCQAIEAEERERETEIRLAQKIAERVVALLEERNPAKLPKQPEEAIFNLENDASTRL